MTGYRAFSYDFVKTFPVLSRGFEIEILYNHIQDENFKKRLNNADIKFKFVDILQAVKLDAYQAQKNWSSSTWAENIFNKIYLIVLFH